MLIWPNRGVERMVLRQMGLNRALAHMLSPNEPSLANCRDHDISGARDLRKFLRARVDDGDCRVDSFLHEQKRERFAHDHAPSQHHDMRTARRDAAFFEQTQTA